MIDKIDPEAKQDILVTEAIIKNISQGNVDVVEQKYVREETLRCSLSGDLNKIKKLVDKYSIKEVTQFRDRQGHVLLNLDEKEDLLFVSIVNKNQNSEEVLKEWNPLLLAIFYENLKIVIYFCESMKINIKAALRQPGLKANQNQPLITFVVNCFLGSDNKDARILFYLWEKQGHLFTKEDLQLIVNRLIGDEHYPTLRRVMFSSTSIQIIKGLPFEGRLTYIKQLLEQGE